MPDVVTITDQNIKDRGYRRVVALAELPFRRFKKGDEMLADHKMRIFIPTGKDGEYFSYEMDAQLFDDYFSTVLPSEPIIIPIQ